MLTGAIGHNLFLEVDPAICHTCRHCQAKAACRRKAIRTIDRDEPPFLDTSLCWQCLSCTRACPFGAVVRHGSAPDTPDDPVH